MIVKIIEELDNGLFTELTLSGVNTIKRSNDLKKLIIEYDDHMAISAKKEIVLNELLYFSEVVIIKRKEVLEDVPK